MVAHAERRRGPGEPTLGSVRGGPVVGSAEPTPTWGDAAAEVAGDRSWWSGGVLGIRLGESIGRRRRSARLQGGAHSLV